MPTSTWRGLDAFVEAVIHSKAESFLDIGIGFGKHGMLFREYSEAWVRKHYYRRQWSTRVEGVEIYGPYIHDLHYHIYDKVYIGDITKIVDDLPVYDMIYAGDVLEHINKPASIQLLGKLIAKAQKVLLVSIPSGLNWLNKPTCANKHEQHVSLWVPEDFAEQGLPGPSAVRLDKAPDGRREIMVAAWTKGFSIPSLNS